MIQTRNGKSAPHGTKLKLSMYHLHYWIDTCSNKQIPFFHLHLAQWIYLCNLKIKRSLLVCINVHVLSLMFIKQRVLKILSGQHIHMSTFVLDQSVYAYVQFDPIDFLTSNH
jgi:hypothetical protein